MLEPLLALVATLLVVPWWRFASSEPKLIVLTPLLLGVFAWRGQRLSFWSGSLLVLAGAYSLWTPEPLDAALAWIVLLPFVLGLSLKLKLESFMLWFTVGVIVNGAFALAQSFSFGLALEATPGQPAGLLLNKNFLGEAAALALVFCFSRRVNMLSLLLALGCAGTLWLAQSKEALLTAVCGVLWQIKPKALLLALPCGLVVLALWNSSSFTVRLDLWTAVVAGWLEAPWGHGFGQLFTLLPLWQSDTLAFRDEHAHNEFLEFLFELGPLGFTWLVGIFARSLWLAPRWLGALVLTLVLECCIAFPLHIPTTAFCAALVLGAALRSRSLARRRTSAGTPELLSRIDLGEYDFAPRRRKGFSCAS